MARKQLEACYMVAGFKLTGLEVKNLQGLRSSLPELAKLVVAKNKFIGKAIEGTPWKALQPCLEGMNAWLLHGEEIPAAITPFRTLQKDLKLDSTAFTGAVVEGSSSKYRNITVISVGGLFQMSIFLQLILIKL